MAGPKRVRDFLRRFCRSPREDRRLALQFAAFLVGCEALLCLLVILNVPYTKIDWDAYMQQVSLFLGGERDYLKIEGDTGPLVYPAGFLYVFSALRIATGGGQVFPAQLLFAILYLLNLAVVLAIYVWAGNVPIWAMSLLCLSKRYHSIFVLRLFNDCVAMLFGFLAVHLCQRSRLLWAAVAMSVGISIKMNLLLMLPGFFLILVKGAPLEKQILGVVLMGAVQLGLALPFIADHPSSYASKAFEFSRVFVHHWTVNFKFVPESIFVSKHFATALLCLHLCFLFAFAHFRWCRKEGGVFQVLKKWLASVAVGLLPIFGVRINQGIRKRTRGGSGEEGAVGRVDPEFVADVLFGCNFVGIVFARSLHYQFYSWYFPTIVFLLFSATVIPVPAKVLLWLLIEACFNVFPSTETSSAVLCACHLVVMVSHFVSTFVRGRGGERKTKLK